MQTPQDLLLAEFNKRKERNSNFSLRAFARYLEAMPCPIIADDGGQKTGHSKINEKNRQQAEFSPTEKYEIAQSYLKDSSVEASKKKTTP